MKGLGLFEPDKFYHLVNHAVGSENLFRCADNYYYFLNRYAYHTQAVFETYAYCLMPNHFHLLIRVKASEELEKEPKFEGNVHKLVMQKVSNWLNGYARAYNIKYKRKGALFIDYTKRFEIESEAYFTTAVNYIHQNPVNHRFVSRPHDWEYCSYHAFLSHKTTKLKRGEVLEWFGGVDEFRKFHQYNRSRLEELIEGF